MCVVYLYSLGAPRLLNRPWGAECRSVRRAAIPEAGIFNAYSPTARNRFRRILSHSYLGIMVLIVDVALFLIRMGFGGYVSLGRKKIICW